MIVIPRHEVKVTTTTLNSPSKSDVFTGAGSNVALIRTCLASFSRIP